MYYRLPHDSWRYNTLDQSISSASATVHTSRIMAEIETV